MLRLFADDTIMYLTITSDVDTVHLQEDLDKLASWELAWMMSFHPEKCNVLTVSRKRNIIKRGYILHGHQLASYTFSFTFGLLMLMFRLRKLSVLFARLHIFAMWTFHLKSDDIVILDILRM
jgi:hypothetical protein